MATNLAAWKSTPRRTTTPHFLPSEAGSHRHPHGLCSTSNSSDFFVRGAETDGNSPRLCATCFQMCITLRPGSARLICPTPPYASSGSSPTPCSSRSSAPTGSAVSSSNSTPVSDPRRATRTTSVTVDSSCAATPVCAWNFATARGSRRRTDRGCYAPRTSCAVCPRVWWPRTTSCTRSRSGTGTSGGCRRGASACACVPCWSPAVCRS
mmetsp:Transcript_31842/g.49280  ORF Transcript_31842/g.49280 Transcript_31842/m.49280 type:complete len:209 (+) Transcript_31842:301-927(+)